MTTNLPVADGVVRLPDAARAAGVSKATLRIAIEDGLIQPTPIRRRHNTRTIRLEDALLLIAVASLAAAAGIAFLSMLRTLRQTGAELRPEGVVIPFPTGAPASVGIAA